MKQPRHLYVGLAVVAASIAGGVVYAEHASTPQPEPQSAGAAVAPPPATEAQPAPAPIELPRRLRIDLLAQTATPTSGQTTAPVPMEEDASRLTPQQMRDKTAESTESIKNALKHAEGLQEAARKERDIIRLDCINQKLVELRGLQSIVQDSKNRLDQAIASGDDSGRLHEYTKCQIASERAVQLGQESEYCAGANLTYNGDTVVEVTIDNFLPDYDFNPYPGVIGHMDRPPEASPFE